MAPTGKDYEVDWIFSNTSSVHVAVHQDWFTKFTPFKSKLTNGAEIEGVGTVELEVKTNIHQAGKHTHRTLVLHDVVYAPACCSNILGRPDQEGWH